MSEAKQPEIKVFQMQQGEFYFLGKEYSLKKPDMKAIWDDFCDGGYEVIRKYRKNTYSCMVLNHNNNPEYNVYSPGTITDKTDEVPKGFTLTKFPAREYLVVTHEWMPTKDEALGQIFFVDQAVGSLQIPKGYERFDGPGSQIMLFEVENFETENGSRWENWVPIKKMGD